MTTILAIDPACERAVSDTGYCFGHYTDEAEFEVLDSGVIHGGYRGFTNQMLTGSDVIPDPFEGHIRHADIIVYEKFVTYNKVADPSQMLIEGVIRYLRPDAVGQPSSGKNTLVPNDFLKEKGLWGTKGSGAGHHRDEVEAIRHAYYYLARNKHIPTLKELQPND